ncbi:hypothetical protein PFISCL1PPCAC_22152, partial [Pristionchus fissidentatus]
DPCNAINCLNNGQCVPTEDASAAQYKCPFGYSGANCNITDACFFAPCRNGGRCVPSPPGFTCECDSRAYYGAVCASFHACYSAPCAHGSTCAETSSRQYKCECSPGWEGRDCDQDINECDPKRPEAVVLCKNTGICININGSYKCECVPGTSGSDCSL